MSDGFFRFRCSQCGKRRKALFGDIGKRAKCSCGKKLTVPTDVALDETVVMEPVETVITTKTMGSATAGVPSFDPYHLWLQVPKEEQPPNHFQLLGLRLGESNGNVIREAFLKQQLYVRTFQAGPYSEHAVSILRELAAAADVLLNETQRATYLMDIQTKQHQVPMVVRHEDASEHLISWNPARSTVLEPWMGKSIQSVMHEQLKEWSIAILVVGLTAMVFSLMFWAAALY